MTTAELLALAGRAQQGDQSVLPALREVLQNPALVDILGGDLARHTQQTLITKVSGDSLLQKKP
jgi:hypothetical protein